MPAIGVGYRYWRYDPGNTITLSDLPITRWQRVLAFLRLAKEPTYLWEIISPPGSRVVSAVGDKDGCSFTPDVKGGYRYGTVSPIKAAKDVE